MRIRHDLQRASRSRLEGRGEGRRVKVAHVVWPRKKKRSCGMGLLRSCCSMEAKVGVQTRLCSRKRKGCPGQPRPRPKPRAAVEAAFWETHLDAPVVHTWVRFF